MFWCNISKEATVADVTNQLKENKVGVGGEGGAAQVFA